jgi:hypothetical protein
VSESEDFDDFDVASAKNDQRRKYLSNSFVRSRCCKLYTISAPGKRHWESMQNLKGSRNIWDTKHQPAGIYIYIYT